jgi:peroxiredoxin
MTKPAKDRKAAVVLAAVALALVAAVPAPAGSATPGMDARRMRGAAEGRELRTLDGRSVSLGASQGEIVVVNFWATWCRPCRKELPALDRLHAELSKRGGRVVAVSIDQDVQNVRRFARTHGLTLPICHDGPEGLVKALDLQHIPFTIVLDRDGEVAFTTSGANDEALAELGAVTRKLTAAGTQVSRADQGETP